MGLFGKKKLSEPDAAAAFVNTIVLSVKENWPSIASKLDELLLPARSLRGRSQQ